MGVGMLEEVGSQVKVTLEPSTTVADPVTVGACGSTVIFNEQTTGDQHQFAMQCSFNELVCHFENCERCYLCFR